MCHLESCQTAAESRDPPIHNLGVSDSKALLQIDYTIRAEPSHPTTIGLLGPSMLPRCRTGTVRPCTLLQLALLMPAAVAAAWRW